MKRYFNFTLIAAILLTFLSQSSCKKGWLDVNYNPQQLTDNVVTPDLLLPPLLLECAALPPDFEILSMWLGYWAAPTLGTNQSLTNYTDVVTGSIASSSVPILEQKSADLGQEFYLGIAKVVRALMWSRCVDKLNFVPYTEAYNPAILHPKYDNGQPIYDDLIKQLTEASGLIKNADVTKNLKITISDIMFHGDKTKWLQFINTLKLRLLIHQANRPDRAAYIAAEIQVIKDQGSGFLPMGVEGAVNPGWIISTAVNPYFGLYSSHNIRGGARGDIYTGITSPDMAHANEYGLNMLKSDNDPRIGFIYSSTDNVKPASGAEPFPQPAPSNFRGSRFGLSFSSFQYPYQNRVYLSAVGGSRNIDVVTPASSGIIKGNNMDSWIITSVENAFLQAEAVFRGWLPGDAEQAYQTAIKASFRWLNLGGNAATPALSDAVFNAWYSSQVNNQRVNWTTAPDKYKLIMYQKYIGLNGIDPIETWTDYRRNGRFPDVPVSADPTRIANTVPIRFMYTPREILTNMVEIKKLGEINAFTDKIWWMP
ncbi:SusD/RagB family nutrient-binding outer membrane lipoprotein [Pedobacter hiemivivus]|uniref:SusD/RagB family nutrient-binding outer membrane lipoprotein n=1 Tax=Pedobacter hiemivivus TaxID=2530454 RepID=A0A4U1GL27_9SPHI|nr:SusD/RagB family nutrient-binding outer membrane lipoprotein [Pedobacter hiemivivus]TCC99465.1 SusD/RagB family nutrient-binding outer membrane lipoprotein [Pedobacter hiemivivus]TKC63690.1 SusD/RagB family nutrient-binding outer membrane lipoprotein [Pedobacter hiemivivus]